MCEIMLTRGNKRGIAYTATDYRRARNGNPDGAGYMIFQKEKTGGRWEVKDIGTFPEEKYTGYEYSHSWGDDYDYAGDWYDKAYTKQKSASKPEPDTVPDEFRALNEELKQGELMVAHFRLATSGGLATHNTHPVIVGDYAVIHNGIFSYTKLKEGASDTRHFAILLQSEAKKKKIIHHEQEQKLIEKLLEEAGGYYSIFIYSWKTGKLYYYKSKHASFMYDSTGLLGATRSERFPVIIRKAKTRGCIV